MRTEKALEVIFLFPEMLRPEKPNHARMFEVLSGSLSGAVFTMASQPHAGTQIRRFSVFAGRIRSSMVRNWVSRLRVQVFQPIWRAIKGERVDVIVTYDPYASGIPGILLKWILRAKLIVQIMGDYHRLDPNDELVGAFGNLRRTGGAFKKMLMKQALRASLSAADAVKVLNRDQERFVRERWRGLPVYRFADFAATNYFGSLATYQGAYLLAVGHPFYRKGVDILIRAFARIADDFPAVRLRILGYAPPSELESYRALAGRSQQIEFVKAGWIEDVREQMRGCFALVHAARSEAMGRVLLEAMACRKPVVCTKTNGGLDYVVDGKTGILCDIDDTDALASAMRRLLENPALADQLGHAGYDHLLKESSEEQFAERFISMVTTVAGRTSRP